MRFSRSIVRKTIAVLLGGLAAGCGGESALPVPVQGTVFFRGTPLSQGTIVFTPDSSRGSSGPFARSEILANGSYDLRTGDKSGALVGWYRVTVVAVENPAAMAVGRFAVPRSLVPEKYRDPELSGLECEIRAGQANRVNFNLQ
jgi:hypothetical protein